MDETTTLGHQKVEKSLTRLAGTILVVFSLGLVISHLLRKIFRVFYKLRNYWEICKNKGVFESISDYDRIERYKGYEGVSISLPFKRD